jgi:hypothetical protein
MALQFIFCILYCTTHHILVPHKISHTPHTWPYGLVMQPTTAYCTPCPGFFSRIFDTHNNPHTPKRAGTTHLRHTHIHHIRTHFVYEYNTYYCTDVAYIGYTGHISQYNYCLFVCITACIHCTSLEWLTVTNDTPPHTLYIPGCLAV